MGHLGGGVGDSGTKEKLSRFLISSGVRGGGGGEGRRLHLWSIDLAGYFSILKKKRSPDQQCNRRQSSPKRKEIQFNLIAYISENC